jgi:hypothetical protein
VYECLNNVEEYDNTYSLSKISELRATSYPH